MPIPTIERHTKGRVRAWVDPRACTAKYGSQYETRATGGGYGHLAADPKKYQATTIKVGYGYFTWAYERENKTNILAPLYVRLSPPHLPSRLRGTSTRRIPGQGGAVTSRL
jgi:hypothetical protein